MKKFRTSDMTNLNKLHFSLLYFFFFCHGSFRVTKFGINNWYTKCLENKSLSILTSKFIYIIKSTSFKKEKSICNQAYENNMHMFLNVTRYSIIVSQCHSVIVFFICKISSSSWNTDCLHYFSLFCLSKEGEKKQKGLKFISRNLKVLEK